VFFYVGWIAFRGILHHPSPFFLASLLELSPPWWVSLGSAPDRPRTAGVPMSVTLPVSPLCSSSLFPCDPNAIALRFPDVNAFAAGRNLGKPRTMSRFDARKKSIVEGRYSKSSWFCCSHVCLCDGPGIPDALSIYKASLRPLEARAARWTTRTPECAMLGREPGKEQTQCSSLDDFFRIRSCYQTAWCHEIRV